HCVLAARCGDCQQLQAGLQQQQQPHPLGANDPRRQQLLASLLAARPPGVTCRVRLLLRPPAPPSARARALWSSQCEPDCQCWTGASALHWAVRREHADVVRELLSRSTVGARLINCRDEDGATPLSDCCQQPAARAGPPAAGGWRRPETPPRRPTALGRCSGDEALARCLIDAGAESGAVTGASGPQPWTLLRPLGMDDWRSSSAWTRLSGGWPSGVKRLTLCAPPRRSTAAPAEGVAAADPICAQSPSLFRSNCGCCQPEPAAQASASATDSSQPAAQASASTVKHSQRLHLAGMLPAIDLTQSPKQQSSSSRPSRRRFHRPSHAAAPEPQLPKLAAYSISEKPRGLCLVLSNENYIKLQPAHGTRRTWRESSRLFEQRLGFIVEVRTEPQPAGNCWKPPRKAQRRLTGTATPTLSFCFLLHERPTAEMCLGTWMGVSGSQRHRRRIERRPAAGVGGQTEGLLCSSCFAAPRWSRRHLLLRSARRSSTVQQRLRSRGQTPLAVSPEDVSGSIFVQTLCDVIDNWLGSDDPTAEVDVEDALMEARPTDLRRAGGSGAALVLLEDEVFDFDDLAAAVQLSRMSSRRSIRLRLRRRRQ
uniref:ANK_REP_REGION domain-containing protein n=1 Tax=Macrostomum lignano TaxID=282301 RepID=A0A1I8FQ38_9PLAT